MDPETLRFSKLIILWGSNTLTTNHHLWRSITTARRNGAHVVVIDPTRTRTADAADRHLALVPGTDAALALGLLHVVLSEGAEDRDFIDRHTLGWDAFRRRILDYPPARVALICGLPIDAIVELGKRIARTRPTGIRVTMGLQRHGGGGMAVRTITCIPGVTGDWRYPGGGVGYDTRGFFGVNWAGLYRDDLRKTAARALSMTRLGEGLLEVTDPPVKALFVYASNPAASVPHQTKIRRGLARPDLFTVVAEHFRTDTVDYADIVLPATMQLEHADVQISYGHLYLSWNEPAVAPPGECLPTTEIFRRLARRLGLDEPCLYDSDEEMARQLLDSDHPSLRGITFDALRKRGWMRLAVPEPFVPFADGFPAPSGKLEFYTARMTEAGLDPLAGYTPPYEAAQRGTPLATRYPLALIAGADHYFLNSGVRERLCPDPARRPGDDPRPPRGRDPPAARDRLRSPRLQRPRRVRRAGRGDPAGPAGRGRQHQGALAEAVEGRRDRQRHRRRARRRHGWRSGLPRQPRGDRATLDGPHPLPVNDGPVVQRFRLVSRNRTTSGTNTGNPLGFEKRPCPSSSKPG
jgi:anaerobic selenocysteine-containing dehydrogenase